MTAATIKTTCPRDCYDACGITVHVRDGAIQKVIGDRDHHISRGTLCGKCALAYNGTFIKMERRLTTPLRRVGPKGKGDFVPASWDEALSDISSRLNIILGEAEARTILHTHYTGTVAMLAGWFPIRFFNRLGATEVDPDTVCNKAGHVALADMFGTSLSGFDPEQLPNARSLIIWGANPSHTAPHMHRNWVASSKASIIVIDPIAHETARAAHLHLQLRPGTDAALAFGMLHVIKQNGLIDRKFIDKHVLGFDAIQADIDAASPKVTEALTGVPAGLIEQAALLFAAGPSLLWLGQGMQRQPRGGNAFRAAALLSIATGHIGRPGAGFCYMNGPETRGVDYNFLMAPGLRRNTAPSISHVDLAEYLERKDRARALFTWNNNILASSPGQSRLRSALAREDLFTVISDLFMTDTAAFADYVLPAASFLEFDDIVFPYFFHTVSAQAKAAEPFGLSLPNQDIFRRLARAMKYEEPELYETDESMLARLLAQTSFKGSFDDLKAVGTVQLNPTPLVQFATLQFNTPSGRIEVYSERFKDIGQPVPVPHADAPPRDNEVRVLSPASAWLMNSTYGNDENVRKRLGEPSVLLSGRESSKRGLNEGDHVILENAAGSLSLTVRVSPDVPDNVALIYKGRWPRYSGGSANVNVLNAGLKSDIAESTAVHGVHATLKRA
jgi:anaerobic selenocysteine-containing dehydrogenase